MSAMQSRMRSFAGQGARMALLSLVSFVAGYALLLLLNYALGMTANRAFSTTVLILSVANFFGCRHYVFDSKPGPLLLEAAKFFPSVLVFRAVEVAVFSFLMKTLRDQTLSYVLTVAGSSFFKLIVSRVLIFRRQE